MTHARLRPAHPSRRHLLSPERLAAAARVNHPAGLARSRGQGNGVRLHSRYFAVVSLAALVLVMAAIAAVSSLP